MAEKCAVCGEKLGGMLLGVSSASVESIKEAREKGLDIPDKICSYCFNNAVRAGQFEKQELLAAAAKSIPVSTINPYQQGQFTILDVVSAHIALGTGPISQILSSVTDFFGEQSDTYNKKIKDAENACLIKLKESAYELGADEVIGMFTTYTELTSGHGMIMVCMNGTAIKRTSTTEPKQ